MLASGTRVLGGVERSQGWPKIGQKLIRTVATAGGKENHGVEREVREMGVCVCVCVCVCLIG